MFPDRPQQPRPCCPAVSAVPGFPCCTGPVSRTHPPAAPRDHSSLRRRTPRPGDAISAQRVSRDGRRPARRPHHHRTAPHPPLLATLHCATLLLALFAAAAAAPSPGDAVRGGEGMGGYCSRFLYLVQCAEERPTPELAAGPESAALQLVYRTPPRPACPAAGTGGGRPRPVEDVPLPPAGGGGGGGEQWARVYGDCFAGGAGPLRVSAGGHARGALRRRGLLAAVGPGGAARARACPAGTRPATTGRGLVGPTWAWGWGRGRRGVGWG
jgi:hypothetical protein